MNAQSKERTPRKPLGNRKRGLSLVETLVSVVVLGTTAMMYAGVFNSQVTQHYSLEEIAIATDLYVRQVELLRQMDLRSPGAATYTQTNLASGCPPFPYATIRTPSNQLDPPVDPASILTSQNSYLLPANSPFVLALPATLTSVANDRVFAISVRANRVRSSTTFQRENTLVKFCIRVDITTEGITRNLLTGEFFREVVIPL